MKTENMTKNIHEYPITKSTIEQRDFTNENDFRTRGMADIFQARDSNSFR
jgi:hypothetical protein